MRVFKTVYKYILFTVLVATISFFFVLVALSLEKTTKAERLYKIYQLEKLKLEKEIAKYRYEREILYNLKKDREEINDRTNSSVRCRKRK